MDLKKIVADMANCECGLEHKIELETLEVGEGIIVKVGDILKKGGFPTKILMVADVNSYRVTSGLYERLLGEGFTVELRVFDDKKVASIEDVNELRTILSHADGLLSVGTGSINDICRYSSYLENKPLAIVATAPSMDGFASDSAPIIFGGFKISKQCRQPKIIIADTKILAESPAELKAAGFGDVMAKYIGIADWRIANLLHGDYYCERVAQFVRDAVAKMVALADKVQTCSPEASGAIMEALVLTGCAMQLAKCTRPASGAEHIISHYWECKKLQRGIISDYHGKKVGVATLICATMYHNLTRLESVKAKKETLDWADIEAHYGADLMEDVRKLNLPNTIIDEIDPKLVEEKWGEIVQIIKDEVPTPEQFNAWYDVAGAVKTGEDIAVDPQLFVDGIDYSPYMRRRVTMMRLLPMLGITPVEAYENKF